MLPSLLVKWLAVTLVVGPVADEAVDEAVESRVPDPPPMLVLDAELAREVVEAAALRARLAEVEAELAALRARCDEYVDPAGFILGGWVDERGVRVQSFEVNALGDDTSGLGVAQEGRGYRAGKWGAVALRVRNLPGRQPWAPGRARLLRADGTSVEVRAVRLDRGRLAADEDGLLVVLTEAPFWSEGELLRLELVDESGTRVRSLGEVRL